MITLFIILKYLKKDLNHKPPPMPINTAKMAPYGIGINIVLIAAKITDPIAISANFVEIFIRISISQDSLFYNHSSSVSQDLLLL